MSFRSRRWTRLFCLLGSCPITIFGALSLVLLEVVTYDAGSVLRVLMIPAYVVLLGIDVLTTWLSGPAPSHWLIELPLYFLPFVLLDVALARAASGNSAADARGTL